jgi:glyoxylase-like metal-dependent hydrolase (beta-lactamase superfamily II)
MTILKSKEPAETSRKRHQGGAVSASIWRILVLGLAIQIVLSLPVTAQSTPQSTPQVPPPMDREKEIALALSACPQFVASKAAVYVLDKTGYVKVRESQNGFTALVQHSLLTTREPQCMDAEGTRTFLPRMLKVAELRAQGKSPDEIKRIVADAVAKGSLQPPTHPGVDYMLSTENVVTDEKGVVATFPPHVMFYAPYLTNADLGSEGQAGGGPAFVAGEGSPYALVIVPIGAHSGPAHTMSEKPSSPGSYRMTLGKFEITALSDGSSPVPMGNLLTNITPAQYDAALRKAFLKDPIDTSVNAFLINTGSKFVLVDTGAGTFLGPAEGKLLSNLKAAGYQPEQIEEIYLTHMHGDHIGGLLADGQAAFPKAIVRAAQAEADFWLSTAQMDAAPEPMKSFFKNAMSALKPYIAAGRFKPFRGDMEMVPGILAKLTPGHTPGSTVYVVESQGEKLVLLGDLVHVAAIQFADPSVSIRFDNDSGEAVAARKKAFLDASDSRYWVAGAHIPFPGIGHVRAAGSGYEFVPAN